MPSKAPDFRSIGTMKLSQELADQIRTYHESLQAAGINGYPADTIRELLHLGLSQVNAANINKVDRYRVYNEMRVFYFRRCTELFRQAAKELDDSMALGAMLHPDIDTDPNSNEGNNGRQG